MRTRDVPFVSKQNIHTGANDWQVERHGCRRSREIKSSFHDFCVCVCKIYFTIRLRGSVWQCRERGELRRRTQKKKKADGSGSEGSADWSSHQISGNAGRFCWEEKKGGKKKKFRNFFFVASQREKRQCAGRQRICCLRAARCRFKDAHPNLSGGLQHFCGMLSS